MSAPEENASSATRKDVHPETAKASQPDPVLFSKTFLKKMAISLRILGKELRRKKLKCFDLRNAHRCLGKKVYEVRSSLANQNPTFDHLDRIHKRIAALREPIACVSSFKEKLKTVLKRSEKIMKIQLLKFKRRRLFAKLGRHIAAHEVNDSEVATEVAAVKTNAYKISAVDREIKELAAGTYPWARRPLRIATLLVVIVCGTLVYHQTLAGPDLSTPRKAVQAFEDALENNDMDLARSIALGEDQRLIDAKTSHALVRAWSRMEIAEKKRFDSEQAGAKERDIYLKRWIAAEEHINGETATVGTPHFVNGQ